MSDKAMARRATAQVAFGGVDITESIAPYLISLTYTDNEENEADDLQLKLHDRDDIWLTSWLGQAINAAASTNTSQKDGGVAYKVTARSGLNVRSGPGKSHSIYGTLTYGSIVKVTGTSGEWSVISYNGRTGYVFSEYLTPSTTDFSSMPTVRYGSYGDTVKTMQQALVDLGYELPRYGVDGSFRSETQAAVKAFQRDRQLDTDGICGPLTWAAIAEAMGATTNPGTTIVRSGFSISAVIARLNWNDDGKDSALDCGQFELDSVDCSGPPAVIQIKATALPFSSQIRQTKKNKAWEAYKLSGIANEMAKKAGMACMYLASGDPEYKRVEQYQTSDISFLSKLCKEAGLSLKASNNIIVIFDQAGYESSKPVLTIKKGDGSYIKYKVKTGEADVHYASCRVRWTTSSGKLIEGIAKVEDYDAEDESNQQLEIRAKVNSIAEAQTLAAKYLRLHNKYQKTASFTLPGNPMLGAGMTVELKGWGTWGGKYIVSQAKHTISNSYTTQIELRKTLEGY